MNRPGADGTRESGKIVLVEATPSGRGPEEQWGYDAAAGHWSVRESDKTILLAACKTLGIPSKARGRDSIVFLRACNKWRSRPHFWTARPRSCTLFHDCAPSGRVKTTLPQAAARTLAILATILATPEHYEALRANRYC